MGVINVCLGAFVERDGRDMTNLLYEKMKSELAGTGVNIGTFDLLKNKQMITSTIASNMYDVVICMETLNGGLGTGTLREWKRLNSRIKIILVISKKKKMGGKKLESLYQMGYYDAVYHEEISGSLLKSIIDCPRTKEQAFVYYGLSGTVDEPMVAPLDGVSSYTNTTNTGVNVGTASGSAASVSLDAKVEPAAAVIKETAVEEVKAVGGVSGTLGGVKAGSAAVVAEESVTENYGFGQSVDRTGNTVASDVVENDFENVLQSMDKLFEDKERVFESESSDFGKTVFTEENSERASADWEGVPVNDMFAFSGDELFRNTALNRVPEDDAMGERILNDYAEEEKVMMSQPFPGVSVKPINVSSIIMPASAVSHRSSMRGMIQDVLDEQLLIVSMPCEQFAGDMESVSFILLVHTGRKGFVENGRYQSSAISLKAYVNCVIDDNLVLLEVPDKDLIAIENSILGRECSLIIKKL